MYLQFRAEPSSLTNLSPETYLCSDTIIPTESHAPSNPVRKSSSHRPSPTPNMSDPSPKPFPLLNLPLELRFKIYDLALSLPSTIPLGQNRTFQLSCRRPRLPTLVFALLRTSRQIHDEVRALVYSHTKFIVRGFYDEMWSAKDWFKGIGSNAGFVRRLQWEFAPGDLGVAMGMKTALFVDMLKSAGGIREVRIVLGEDFSGVGKEDEIEIRAFCETLVRTVGVERVVVGGGKKGWWSRSLREKWGMEPGERFCVLDVPEE
ncbi:hypothetical protein M011DRAFT_466637 [Sporormia fimetaria CBS 119925]|uniref:F-box domain-containing protein n=1 Tax=Sporormia fimetaria CBS 119925 TaxID=1340428 RepID=A0A6A6VID9_9PLEO|nr:hypothetical protein M011DRAFT_466637 [Sporormia fimetaria CBS 119925]